MKRVIIAVLALGIAATAMARFDVYQVVVNATILEEIDDKGFHIENGVKTIDDLFVFRGVTGKGLLLEDEECLWSSFIFLENGFYEQNDAYIMWDFWWANQSIDLYGVDILDRYAAKGIASARIEFDIDDAGVSIDASVSGKWGESWKEVADDPFGTYKFMFSGKGTGIGDADGMVTFPVKNVLMKYNSKLSDALWNAWFQAGGMTNETDGVDAVMDVLNAVINKAATVNNADVYWPVCL